MKYNAYSIILNVLREDDSSVFSDPIELTSVAADKVINAAEKFPRKKFGNWVIQQTAKSIKHFADNKKKSSAGVENKLKGD